MVFLPSKKCGVKYLFCVRDVFLKYACVKHFKTKTVIPGFVKRFKKSKRKPNKLWVDQVL